MAGIKTTVGVILGQL